MSKSPICWAVTVGFLAVTSSQAAFAENEWFVGGSIGNARMS